MDSSPNIARFEIVAANLRTTLCALLAALGGWRLDGPRAVVVYRRISRTLGRIERMLVRFREGRLWRVTRRDAVVGTRGRVAGRGPALPRRFGWLVVAGGYQAAGFGCQLQAVLITPEMSALLAASPQARRILRPLCRALAVEVPEVSQASRPVAAGERPKRVRKPRPKPEPFRIPLPRGVLSAARRQGFGKMV